MSGRRIKLFMATSLDGFIARPDGSVDWLYTDGDFGRQAFFASVDTVLIGRRTHDQMVAAGRPSYPGLRNYVFSRSRRADDGVPVTYVTGDVEEFVGSLRRTSGRDIWLAGGADLVDTFREFDLIDDVVLSVHPVLLGDGIRLFPDRHGVMPLELVRCVEYEHGLVQLWYRRAVA